MVLEVEQHAYLVDQEVKHRDVHLHFYLKKKKGEEKKRRSKYFSNQRIEHKSINDCEEEKKNQQKK